MDCLFDKDYDVLVIKGKPTEQQKQEAWQKIYTEYVTLLGEGSGNDLYEKTVEINYLAGKIFVVDKIIKHLQISYNSELIDILKYHGVSCNIIESDTREERFKKLQQVVGRVKRWVTEIEVLRKEYDSIQSEHTDKKGGYEYFDDSLANISLFRKYAITSKDITVRQFVKALKSIEKEAIRLASQTH